MMTARTTNAACDPDCPDGSRTLGIIREFRKLYEDKMRIIEAEGSGDCTLQAKLSLQADWIRDLNEQNEMLVRAVEELEQEATERVVALEEKLRQSSSCACEVMSGYKDLSNAFQHVDALKEDVDTLLEFVKTSAIQQTWDVETLSLRTVSVANVLDDILVQAPGMMYDFDKMKQDMALKDKNIKMLQLKLDDAVHCKRMMAAEVQKECNRCEDLQKSMLDMRDALAAEVAAKHDAIIALKRDVQALEEQCKKADQQTHFKDDIIKELRKEIKQLKCERGSYSFPEPDALINKLNNVCDSIDRKLAWSTRAPKPRYQNDSDPYGANTCVVPRTNQTTQTRTALNEACCQTNITNCMKTNGVQCTPPDEEAKVCRREQKLAMLSQPPIQLPCALPPIPLPMPPRCGGFDVPVLDTNKPCSAAAPVVGKMRERGCQTVTDRKHVPVQCSMQKLPRYSQNADERLLQKTNLRLTGDYSRFNIRGPERSSSSEDKSESLMTLQSLPSDTCITRFPRSVRPCVKENRTTRVHNRPSDRLHLGALNIERSQSYQAPRASIYMDSRFHKFIQIQEENQPPRLCSASLINLTKILHNRPRQFVVDRVPTGKQNDKDACSCGTDRPINQRTIREIARNADYLAVKAAIDVSQKRTPEPCEQPRKRSICKSNKCECKVSVDCFPPPLCPPPTCLPPLQTMSSSERRDRRSKRIGTNLTDGMLTKSFLYPTVERRRRPEGIIEIDEESSSTSCASPCLSSSSSAAEEEKEDHKRVLRHRSRDDIEDKLRSQIVEEIVRQSISRASETSTDSAFKSGRSTRRSLKTKNIRRKSDRTNRLSRPNASDLEIYQMSTKPGNPFDDNNKAPSCFLQDKTTPNNFQNRTTSLSHSSNGVKGQTDNNDKVSKPVSLPPIPKLTPSAPPIPCVSRMLRESQPRQVKRLPVENQQSNAEYIHGLFEFLRKTKKLAAEIDNASFTDTTTPSEISDGGRKECAWKAEGEEREDVENDWDTKEDTREDIIKQIDWTEVAKLFR